MMVSYGRTRVIPRFQAGELDTYLSGAKLGEVW